MFQKLAESILRAAGWTIRNDVPPDLQKFVVIAAPHTSNWDFPVTMLLAKTFDLDFYWIGKHTLFEGPLGPLMHALGGIPVDRRKSQNLVEQIAEAFDDNDRMVLGIAPEGTRSSGEFWKSGFYYIAREAGVPIVLGFVDWKRKEGGLGPVVDSTQTKSAVMEKIRGFYADVTGYHHDNFIPPRLRDETDDA